MSKTDCIHIASGFAGIFEVLVSHPLDRVKTELQIMTLNNTIKKQHTKNPSVISGIQHIYKNNGFKGFYFGIIPRLIGIIPMRLMYWSTMNYSSDYATQNYVKINNMLNKYFVDDISNFIIKVSPGLITGIAQSLIDNPIEVAKIKLMSGANEIKISDMYRGFGYLLSRNILFAIPVAYSVKQYGTEYPFMAGAIGGLIGSIISHPLDVIKTERQRHQIDGSKKITISKLLLNNPSSIMSGLLMRASLSFVNMGVGFMVFNYIYRGLYLLRSYNEDNLK